MKKLIFLTLFASLGLLTALSAQGGEPIRVWADGASYIYFQDSSKSYVEVYVAIQRMDVQFQDTLGTYLGSLLLYLEILDKSGAMVDSVGSYFPIPVKFLEDAYDSSTRVFEVLGLTLSPADYKVRLTAVDLNSGRNGLATFELKVRDYSGKSLQLSDLELAYLIRSAPSDSVYSSLIKMGRKVLPNPNGYFSNEDSMVYVYAELYNLAGPVDERDSFELEIKLLDDYGYEIREFPKIYHGKPGESAVITEAIPLPGLPGGEYTLHLEARDPATARKASVQKRFVLVYTFDQLSPTMSSADVFGESDAELMEQVIYYISSKEEKELYRSANLEGKKRFLQSFWERKNPVPGSKINSYKDDIFRRFLYANHHFSSSMVDRKDGWRSDRGRVYITYGEPDEIDRHPSTMQDRPYEIWFFNRIEGGSGGEQFVFVDDSGYGNYRLVHSTMRGEISNPQWEQLLDITATR